MAGHPASPNGNISQDNNTLSRAGIDIGTMQWIQALPKPHHKHNIYILLL